MFLRGAVMNAKQCRDLGKPCSHAMTPDRIFVLESMSWWGWDAQEAAWETKFEEVQEYVNLVRNLTERKAGSCSNKCSIEWELQ